MKIPENIDFAKYAAMMAERESGSIHPAGYWAEAMVNRFIDGNEIQGDTLPWTKTHSLVRFRPGELSVWAGMNGHKKSLMLGQIMANFALQGNVAIASLEMKPEDTLLRICKQCKGGEITEDYLGDFIVWANKSIIIYDELDKVKWNRIIGFIYYCAVHKGCSHILIDSLTKCGIPQGDGAAEKDFIDRLQWAAKSLNCHIHLICHVRKPQNGGESYIPNKFDVRGVGELTDLVDNVFIVWTDKKKKELLQKEYSMDLSLDEKEHLKGPDQRLLIEKQRNGSYEGHFKLWFHTSSLQFTNGDGIPLNFELKPNDMIDRAELSEPVYLRKAEISPDGKNSEAYKLFQRTEKITDQGATERNLTAHEKHMEAMKRLREA